MADAASYTIPLSVQRLMKAKQREEAAKADLEHQPKLKISEAISRVAFIYEKVRNALDYKEEHLLIKAAIQRILKRKFVPGVDPASIARPLVVELIRGGYIRNNTLPESTVDDAAKTLVKYARFLSKAIPPLEGRQREETFDWAITMLSCELEEVLSPSPLKAGMVEFVYMTMLERIDILSKRITEDERKVQIYTAVLKAYSQYDLDLISYNLLKYFYPEWQDGKEEALNRVARNVVNVRTTIQKQMKHPLQEKLVRQMKKINILFTVLNDWLKKADDPMATLQSPNQLIETIEETTNQRYKQVKVKLRRTSLRSIIYLFITKMLLAIILEFPYDYFILGHLNYVPLAINVVFHPLLLFVIALAVHVPAKENTQKIIEGIKDLVYGYEGKDVIYRIRPNIARGWFLNFVFRLLYLVAFLVTFGGLIIVLTAFGFNWLGVLLFTVFLTLVSFFGLRVRQLAKDLVVLDRRDNLLSVTIDFFAIPIVRAGRWLSVNFSKINVFVFVLDVIIEAPFKLIIDVFEDWFAYMREKREEIYD
ncbi:MAG: hypothetical protein ACD_41C00177G0014 [uncultured bacterium]|nr:MAG: hypothetical protein ACD_41C00177G0014 [uncultured bacterium]